MVQTVKSNGVWMFFGLSTDDKDSARETIPAPSFRPLIFNEVDTGKQYYYDADDDEWKEMGGTSSSTPDEPDPEPLQ